MKPVRFALVGIGGFGQSHLNSLALLQEKGKVELVAAADMALDKLGNVPTELEKQGVHLYSDAKEMLAKEKGCADIVSLPVGIAAHVPLSTAAMEAGYDVYVEKPLAATIQEADKLIEVQKRTGKFCAVGYQFISSPLVRRLKALIMSGAIGKLESLSCYALWPRAERYYNRNPWAGRIKVGDNWVLDGPVNNALAPQLTNLLFLAGSRREEGAVPTDVQAEFYQAHEIEGEDTDCLRAHTEDGAEIFITLTHACKHSEQEGPIFSIIGSEGKAEGNMSGPMTVNCKGGEDIILEPAEYLSTLPFENVVDYFRGDTPALHCPVTVARCQTITLNAAYESARKVHRIPDDLVHRETVKDENEENVFTWVEGLPDVVHSAFEERKLFSELGVAWARSSQPFVLDNYKSFTGADL